MLTDILTLTAAIFAVSTICRVLICNGEKRVEKARLKKTQKAREYQHLIKLMPDVVWTPEIYNETYNF